MVGRKGDAYLGGHTIWPKNVGSADVNDLALKRKRRIKQLEKQRKDRLRKKELDIISVVEQLKSKPQDKPQLQVRFKLPVEYKHEREIGFFGNSPSIYFGTVKAALVRAKNDRLQTDDEIARYWNAIGFRTPTGKKWFGPLVAAARRKVKLPKSRRKSRSVQNRGVRLTGRILREV